MPSQDTHTTHQRTAKATPRYAAVLRQPWAIDLARALAFLALWLGGIQIALALNWYPDDVGIYFVIGLVGAIAFLLCRRVPLAGLLVVSLASTWQADLMQIPGLRIVPLVIAGYLAASAGLSLIVIVPILATATVLVLVPVLSWIFDYGMTFRTIADQLPWFNPSTRILAACVVLAAIFLGRSAYVQRRTVEELRLRNSELEGLQEADRARIAAEERTAIAREIHDVVAHYISAMVIRAQAADRVADDRPDEPREAVRWIARNGQDALGAMRNVVRVLRTDAGAEPSTAPATFPDALLDVITRVGSTGLAVTAALEEPLELDALQGFAVVRIAQEALTNVLLHSSADRVVVSLRQRGPNLELSITDNGVDINRSKSGRLPGQTQGVIVGAGGNGIRGMRERAESLGGRLWAGHEAGIGWAVSARFPLDERDRLTRAYSAHRQPNPAEVSSGAEWPQSPADQVSTSPVPAAAVTTVRPPW